MILGEYNDIAGSEDDYSTFVIMFGVVLIKTIKGEWNFLSD
jgi:hypothetical protein